MCSDQLHWRWNADTTWHYFCSMQFEAARANEASNDFMRYHHLRSCIYFAIGVVESLMNQEMRRHLENAGKSEEEIHTLLFRTRLSDKLDEWPKSICAKPIAFAPEVMSIFHTYRELRNEITHPKKRDHSIYVELDRATPFALVEAIARAIVTICEGKERPFPYWVLGWNYVGLNNDPAHPFQGNNMNGFMWSLKNMGFSVNVNGMGWDRRQMSNVGDYEKWKALLDKYPFDIEPYWPRFSQRPRLTRRWWDHEFIYADIKMAEKNVDQDV